MATPVEYNPDPYAWSALAWAGAGFALIWANAGAAYGTAKSGISIGAMAVTRPNLVFKAIIPVIMAGILSIYGLIIAVILGMKIKKPDEESANDPLANYDFSFDCINTFWAGLCCGLCQIAAGYAIGIVGDGGVRFVAQNENIFVGLLLILIFAEVLGLFGMIVAIIVSISSG